MDALANGQLSLAEAAAITEFEDMPGALERLLNAPGLAASSTPPPNCERARLTRRPRPRRHKLDRKGYTVLSSAPNPATRLRPAGTAW